MADVGLLSTCLEELRDKDVKAELDLTDVRVPGVWLRLRTVEHETLDGEGDTLGVEVVAVVKARNPERVYRDLFDLYDQVKEALGIPDDIARLVTVNHPEGGSLPGLAIPYQLL